MSAPSARRASARSSSWCAIGPAALTQQCYDLAAHAADSAAGTGHQDETRLSHRPPPFVATMSGQRCTALVKGGMPCTHPGRQSRRPARPLTRIDALFGELLLNGPNSSLAEYIPESCEQ
jgi:hypothetical protein